MQCSMRETLFNEWKRTVELYAEMSATLSARSDIGTTDLLDPWEALTQIGKIADRLQSDLHEHINKHGCG